MATLLSTNSRISLVVVYGLGDSMVLDRITFDPEVMGGRACIRGMRLTVALVVNLVANAMTTEEILEAYPSLESEDIRQALQYAAWLAEETNDPIPVSK